MTALLWILAGYLLGRYRARQEQTTDSINRIEHYANFVAPDDIPEYLR